MPQSLRKLILVAGLLLGIQTGSAYSGAFDLAPGNQTWIDTDPQGFTTISIRNLGQEHGRVEFPGGQFSPTQIAPGGAAELYARVSRPAIQVVNTGNSRLEVITRYMDRPRFTP